jgi:hypothetical protein
MGKTHAHIGRNEERLCEDFLDSVGNRHRRGRRRGGSVDAGVGEAADELGEEGGLGAVVGDGADFLAVPHTAPTDGEN